LAYIVGRYTVLLEDYFRLPLLHPGLHHVSQNLQILLSSDLKPHLEKVRGHDFALN
jgi:hypothetical protein